MKLQNIDSIHMVKKCDDNNRNKNYNQNSSNRNKKEKEQINNSDEIVVTQYNHELNKEQVEFLNNNIEKILNKIKDTK